MHRNILSRMPTWASRWLGYRATPSPQPAQYIVWIWAFIGSFGSLSVLQAMFGFAPYFIDRNVPSIIASYGASAVLCYNTIAAPLAQPRALLGGHFLSALVGVIVTKLFHLLPTEARYDSLRWLAASLSTAIAIVVMDLTGTTHPPAGATALLPAVDEDVWELGWYYLPIVLLSSVVMLVIALGVNNIQRRYPMFWIAPAIPAAVKPSPALGSTDDDLEKK